MMAVMGVWLAFVPIADGVAKWLISGSFVVLASAMICSNILQERVLTAEKKQRETELNGLIAKHSPLLENAARLLGNEMAVFIWKRRALAPQTPVIILPSGIATIEPDTPAAVDYERQTSREFSEKFDQRMRVMVAELRERGAHDADLDGWLMSYHAHPEVLDGIALTILDLSDRVQLLRNR
jgi:hypothetical protein